MAVLNILSSPVTAGQQPQPEQQAEGACEDDSNTATSDNIAFTVLSKKGNKQQVRHVHRFEYETMK